MSKKLVEEALSDKSSAALSTVESNSVDSASSSYVRKAFSYRLVNGKFVLSGEPLVCEILPVYPPNITDQTHGLSIADQLHRGQGDGTDLDSSSYDFPDGHDDGRDPISPFAYSEPAEAWEAEQDFKSELSSQARTQALAAQRAADSAQKETIEKAQKTASNASETKVDEKTSTQSN